VIAVARSATAVKCDGYPKPRARQVQQLVLRRRIAIRTRGRAARRIGGVTR